MAEPFFAIPRGREALIGACATVFAIVSFVAVYGAASFVSGHVPWSISLMTPLDRAVPFVPAAAVVYLSMDLLVGLAPFVLRRPRKSVAFACTLVAQTVCSAVVFVVLPIASEFPVREVATGTLIDPIFAIADTLNMERNFFPSLHVAFATTAALAYAPRAGTTLRALLYSWAAAIAASTMFLHEHYVIDVVGGVAVAALGIRLVFRPLQNERACIEGIIATEIARTGLRHPRYLVVGALLYRASFPRFAERRVLRTGYCFLQAIDDLLDGDRPSPGPPADVVDALLVAAEGRGPENTALARLGVAFNTDLDALPDPEKSWRDVRALVDVMKHDYRRVRERHLSTQAEIWEQLRATFTLSVDLMLAAGGTRVRAADVPALIDALGWCSVVRDLREDLRRGLVNVPRDVVLRTDPVPERLETLASVPATLEWLASERERAIGALDRADAEIAALSDRPTARVLALFARSIRRYTARPSVLAIANQATSHA